MDASKRNKNAGNNSSYDKLGMSAKSIARKKKYDTEYQKSPARKKYRAELNAANRKAGTYGNSDHKDMSHTKSGKLVSESQKSNRARNGQGGKSTKKLLSG